ncbi:glycosyltransferase [Alphaproteobacteria bacterium]|nr:glycosyltransferase [Alphaproteobacteria bacterium]
MKSVYYWSPFLTHVATISAVIESAKSLKRYSKKYDPVIIDACGEFESYKKILLKNKIKTVDLTTFKYFKLLPKNGFFKSRFSYILIFFFSFIPLYKVIKKESPDYFICHLITSLPMLLAKLFNFHSKFILRISGLPKFNFFRKFYWKICGNVFFKITSPTNATINHLQLIKMFDEKRILLLRDPIINIQKIQKLKKQKIDPYFEKNQFIVAIGRLTKQKNFKFLISCFQKLTNSQPNLKLVILGDGEEMQNLKRLIHTKNLENNIFLLGHLQNVFKYLSRAKLFILSSLWEDPGWVLLEAAASNTLILSSDCKNGPSEIIDNNNAGQLYKVDNEQDFINKFNQIMSLDKMQIDSKKLFAKKKSYLFTKFQHFKNLEEIIST